METKRISRRVPAELLEVIDQMAQASELSRSAIVIEALEAWAFSKETVEIDSPIETAVRVQNIEKVVRELLRLEKLNYHNIHTQPRECPTVPSSPI